MWAVTPTFSLIYAYFSWAGFCLARIWFFSLNPYRFGWFSALPALVLRRLFYTLYGFLGLWLLDLTARFVFSGLISYGSFLNIAAPALLCAAIGGLYVFRGMFFAPSRGELIAFSGMTAVYLYLTLVVPDPPLKSALYAGGGMVLAAIPVELLERLLRRRRLVGMGAGQEKSEEEVRARTLVRPLWDLTGRIRLFDGWALYCFVLLLLAVELVLQLEGYTLFRVLQAGML